MYVSPRAHLDPDSGCIEFFARFDVDNNGYYDLVCADDSGPWLSLYFGSAAGYSPANCQRYPVPGGGNIDLADLNLDGYAELIHSGWRSGHVTVYWGTDSGPSPTDTTWLLVSGQSEAVAVYDLDRDSYLDILAGSDNGNLYVFWGSRDGYSSTSRSSVYLNGQIGHNLEVADFDQDGYGDIAASLWSRNRAAIIYWGAGRTPREIVWLPVSANNPHGITVADLNEDDWLDIVFTGYDTVTTAYVYYGSETGFAESRRELIHPGQCYGGSAAVAWNSDKTLDLVFFRGDWGRTNTYRPRVFFNRLDTMPHFSDARFTEIGDLAFNASGGFAADLNFDGYLDLFINNMLPDSSSFVLWGPEFLTATALPVDRDHHGVWREPGNIYNRGFNASYLSSVFDIGSDSVITSGTCSWVASEPTGSAVGIEVRSGRTAEPDSGWTDFYPVVYNGAGLPAAVTGRRFLQYRCRFSYTRPCYLPHLERISFELNPAAAVDVGVLAILAPRDTVDSGTVAIPAAVIRNNATSSIPEVRVRLTVGTTYAATVIDTLRPGQTDTVSFPAWTATIPGLHAVRCSVYAAFDEDPANDTLSTTVIVRTESDVGPTAILAPPVTAESGSVHVPSVAVRNFGTRAEIFPVYLRIGTSYYELATDTLNPGAIDTVFFPPWTATPPGLHTVRCSTALARDDNPANDTISRITSVTSRIDAAAIAILAPTDTVDSGTVVTPRAQVANLGLNSALVPVRLTIGTTYDQTATKLLLPGTSDTIHFPAWTASPLGTHAVRCSTMLSGDTFPANDTVSSAVTVVPRTDAELTAIISPSGTLDSGTAITPAVLVTNLGSRTENIPVTLTIGAGYSDSATITLNPAETDTCYFTTWTAQPVGNHPVTAFTSLANDRNRTNDTARTQVSVTRHVDAAAIAILAPTGTLESGTVVTPVCSIANYSTSAQNVPVHLTIAPGYSATTSKLLAPGQHDTVSFRNWTASPLGTHAVRCSTMLSGDEDPSDDTVSTTVTVRPLIDATPVAILTPTGTVDSGTVVFPRVAITNLGSRPETVPLHLTIGTTYADSVAASVLPGATDTFTLAAWTASPVGLISVRCSTSLADDQHPENDTLSGTVLVTRHIDAASITILAPTGSIDSGTTVTPQARIANLGTSAAVVPVRMKIGTTYSRDTSALTMPAETVTVAFPAWTASPLGTHAVRCSTMLSGDTFPANDTVSSAVTVVPRIDAELTAIISPSGTLDSGTAITPAVLVTNLGSRTENIPVTLTIGAGYSDSATITLNPTETDTCYFTTWTAQPVGNHPVTAFTSLANDRNRTNDTARTQVSVTRHVDAASITILAPTGTLDSGTTVTPQARIANLGTSAAFIPTTLTIGTSYTDTVLVNVFPSETLTVSFRNWTASPLGTHAVRCSTGLAGDENPANDTLGTTVIVRTESDVGPTAILAPPVTAESGSVHVPSVTVRNFGTRAEIFPVYLQIGTSYYELATDTLNPGAIDTVFFPPWTATPPGLHTVRCSTALARDDNPANDTISRITSVTSRIDAAAIAILAPTDSVDSGTVVIPQARIANLGTSAAFIPTTLTIGTSYTDTVLVNVLPAETLTVSFRNWTASPLGTHAVRCSTGLAGDENPANDTAADSVIVGARVDAGITAILAPQGTVDSGVGVIPVCRAVNNSVSPRIVPVALAIGTSYYDVRDKYLLPGQEDTVTFALWPAAETGTHVVRCSTGLAGDENPANDTLGTTVRVRVRMDAAARSILAPTGYVDSGTTVTPQALVANKGMRLATFTAFMSINPGYRESISVVLPPDSSAIVSFSNWVASEVGTFRVCCSTALAGDVEPANDTAVASVTVATRHDASCYLILSPSGIIDSGNVTVPAARVTNAGTGPELIPVVMHIEGGYCDTTVVSVAPGESVTVNFASWVASPVGLLAVRCSTALSGDTTSANDLAVDSVSVVAHPDAAVTDIHAPLGVVDSGTAIVPFARICNYGSSPAEVPVRMRIGDSYDETRSKFLGVGAKDTVHFPVWTASPPGTHVVTCSTALAGDVRPQNDLRADSVRVVTTIDAGVLAILAPRGRVDSGTTVVPLAVVANCGTSPAFIPVRMRIGADYDSMVFKLVGPNTEDTVPFPAWLASPVGDIPVRCSTALPGDLFTGNDCLTSGVLVGVTVDAACTSIESPDGTVDSGAVVVPLVRVANYSTSPKEIPVLLRIGADYVRGRRKRLDPGVTDTVIFPPWSAHPRGIVALTCSTALHGDERAKNDCVRKSVLVHDHMDAAVLDILVPVGLVDSGHAVTPKARIANHGAVACEIPVELRIGGSYRSRRTKALGPGTADTVHFDVWTAVEPGRHAIRCTTLLDEDRDPANDFQDAEVSVQWHDVGCIAILAPPGVVRAGDTVSPRARVRNFGTQPERIPAVFRYGQLYASLQFTDTLPPGDSSEVTFPALVVAPGPVTASCSTALHCDMYPPNDKLTLPVYGAVRQVVIEPDTAAAVPPASIVSYFMKCRNEGNAADTIDITTHHTRPGWQVELLDSAVLTPLSDLNNNGLPDVGHVPAGGSASLVCRLTLPTSELGLITDSTEVQASSGTDPRVTGCCHTYTTVLAFAGLLIEPDQLCQIPPGTPHEYAFTVTNLGNVADYADIAFFGSKGRWRHELLDGSGKLLGDRNANGRRDIGPIPPLGGTAKLTLRVTPDGRAQVGELDTATIAVLSFADPKVTDTATAISEVSGAVRQLVIEPDQTASVNVGANTSIPLWVETAGEIRAVVNIAVHCSRPDWQLRLLDAAGQEELRDTDFDSLPDLSFVTPAVRTPFALRVTAPGCERLLGSEESLTANVTLVASLSGNPALCDTARVTIAAIPNLEVHNVANPFSDRTRFILSTPTGGRVSLLVYNRLGELVRTIVADYDRQPGIYSAEWDGTNDFGRRLAPGIYVYVLEVSPANGGTQRAIGKAALRR